MNLFRLTIIALMGAGSLYGEPPRRGERGEASERKAEGNRDFKGFFENADTNGDGDVSLMEFSALERIAKIPEEKRNEIFKRFDKNGDGAIQRNEMRPPDRPEGGRRPFPKIHELDTNKDGKVSFGEFEQGPFASRMPKERLKEFFAKLDTNEDGSLSPADMSPDRRSPRDRSRDGRPEDRDPAQMIEMLDSNDNNVLSFEEFRQAPWLKGKGEDEQEDLFEKSDKNGDLAIDQSELSIPGPKAPKGEGSRASGRRGPKGPDRDQ